VLYRPAEKGVQETMGRVGVSASRRLGVVFGISGDCPVTSLTLPDQKDLNRSKTGRHDHKSQSPHRCPLERDGRLHVEISGANRAVLAFRSGGVRNITDGRRYRRQRHETPQGNANTTAPETISVAPIAPRRLKRSPRNVIESNIAATTLSLSIGATLVTSPICSARK
jgi:hypothetical protein